MMLHLPLSRSVRSTALVALLLGAVPGAAAAQDSVSVDPGVLAAQQLERGEQWFHARCVECHASSALTNADFQFKWSGRSALDLLELIRSTMPENEPGTLTRGTYTSIVAYLMKLNGMPVGSSALPSDSTALAAVRLSFVPPSTINR